MITIQITSKKNRNKLINSVESSFTKRFKITKNREVRGVNKVIKRISIELITNYNKLFAKWIKTII